MIVRGNKRKSPLNSPVQSGHGNVGDTVGRESQACHWPGVRQMYRLAGILLKSLLLLH